MYTPLLFFYVSLIRNYAIFSVSINPIFGTTLQVFTGNTILVHFYFWQYSASYN